MRVFYCCSKAVKIFYDSGTISSLNIRTNENKGKKDLSYFKLDIVYVLPLFFIFLCYILITLER